jgi:PhoPQ-activated pathogenicity-related protein
VADLEREGVRHCYTDFFLATRLNFLSRERIVCSAKLGPITTEYFFEYRERVEKAPEAAFVAVNRTSAGRLERRLRELGVSYEREELLKPVLLRLSRKVDPEELFPGREFPLR